MKKNYIVTTCMLGLALGLTSCSEPMDEIENLIFDRDFSPINLEASNVNETAATIKWTASAGARAYRMEVFADDSLTFAGTATATHETEATSIALKALVYDTKYSVRVMALDSTNEKRNSKWSTVYFRTNAQQILHSIGKYDAKDRYVNLSWPAGEQVTQVVVYAKDGTVVKTQALTAEQIANGKATIDGLTPLTNYSVKLFNGNKQRGNRSFTTILDLNGATVVSPGDDLAEAIKNAPVNATIALYDTIYTVGSETAGKAGAAAVDKNISIMGIYASSPATIKGRFELKDGAALTIKNVILDGADNATPDQVFNYKTADAHYGALTVENSEIKNYAKGFYYLNVSATVDAIRIDNCLIHDIECDGGDMFDCRSGYIKTLTLSNNTIWNCAQERDFIRYDDKATLFGNPVPVINLTSNTIYNCLNKANGKRLLYIRFNGKADKQQITVANNLFVNTQAVYTNQNGTATPTYKNNYYFGCSNANLFAASNTEEKLYWNGDTSGSNGANPQLANPTKGNFTIGNADVSKLSVGASRWYKKN